MSDSISLGDYVTQEEAASILGCSLGRLRYLRERGLVGVLAFGPRCVRLKRVDVEKLREQQAPGK